jgi:hypothetical protein
MKYTKIFLIFIILLILLTYACELLPVSIEQRIASFESDLNKSAADRPNADFQKHFHTGITYYDDIAGAAGHGFFEPTFPVEGPDYRPFDIQLDGSAYSVGGGQMRQDVDIIRDGGAVNNFLSSETTYFILEQEGGESWYIVELVAEFNTIID